MPDTERHGPQRHEDADRSQDNERGGVDATRDNHRIPAVRQGASGAEECTRSMVEQNTDNPNNEEVAPKRRGRLFGSRRARSTASAGRSAGCS